MLRLVKEPRPPRAWSSITLRLLFSKLSHSSFLSWPKAFSGRVERLLLPKSSLLKGILHALSSELAKPKSVTSWMKLFDKLTSVRLLRLHSPASGRVHKLLPVKFTNLRLLRPEKASFSTSRMILALSLLEPPVLMRLTSVRPERPLNVSAGIFLTMHDSTVNFLRFGKKPK